MELIVISQNKLKIMLTPPDMQRYDLLPEHLDCADEQTRRAFRHIFDDARDRIGFDTSGERLFVQLYTSRGGGCEIFVTKLGERDGLFSADRTSTEAPEDALLRRVLASCDTEEVEPMDSVSQNIPTPCHLPSSYPPEHPLVHPCVLVLPDLATLLSVCHRLDTIGYATSSSAYIDDQQAYLFLHISDRLYGRLPERMAFLAEYGRICDSDGLSLYVTEHARMICSENAVKVLGALK